MIIWPSRKPRSRVRGPTESLKENVSPGRSSVPSMYSAISCTLWIRFDEETPMSVVKVEICSRMPSVPASRVVRSARVSCSDELGDAQARVGGGGDVVQRDLRVHVEPGLRRGDPDALRRRRGSARSWRACATDGGRPDRGGEPLAVEA